MTDYQTQFEKLLIQVGTLTPAQQVCFFSSALKESIKIFKAGNHYVHSLLLSQISTYSLPLSPNPMPIKKSSPTKLKERRDKRLCFNCNEKFGPENRFKKLYFIEGYWSDGEGNDVDLEVEDVVIKLEMLEISMHSIYGMRALQTMKVQGNIAQHQITILMHSRSTDNFLTKQIARKLGISPNAEGNFEVAVASG